MALVEARLNLNIAFDDFVAGKGKGFIILLQYDFTQVLLTYANI
jgi:hypothetical protein